jgi:transcriptional regulator with XRE-family HTH domain
MTGPADVATGGEVGPRLRQLRERKSLSARQVAELAGVTPAYLSRLENGRVSPTVATLARLVAAMGETMATLFSDAPGPRDRSCAAPSAT